MKKIMIGLFCIGTLNAFAETRDQFSIDCSKRTGGNTIGQLASLSLKGIGKESFEVNELECTLFHGVCMLPYQSEIQEQNLVREGNIFQGNGFRIIVRQDHVAFETKEKTTLFTESECTLSL